MTQRSRQRWNTGKRGAVLAKARKAGKEDAEEMKRLAQSYLNPKITNKEVIFEMYALGRFDAFPRSPRIAAAYRNGAHALARREKEKL